MAKKKTFDFEDGTLQEWVDETGGNFGVRTDVARGTYSIGANISSAQQLIASWTPSLLEGGVQIPEFETYWYETVDGTGGGIKLFDADGNMVVGVASNNTQWMIDDAAGETEVGPDEHYSLWVYVKLTFNWSEGTYTYYFENTESGYTSEGTGTLINATNIASAQIINYNSGWTGSTNFYMWFDDFTITIPDSAAQYRCKGTVLGVDGTQTVIRVYRQDNRELIEEKTPDINGVFSIDLIEQIAMTVVLFPSIGSGFAPRVHQSVVPFRIFEFNLETGYTAPSGNQLVFDLTSGYEVPQIG